METTVYYRFVWKKHKSRAQYYQESLGGPRELHRTPLCTDATSDLATSQTTEVGLCFKFTPSFPRCLADRSFSNIAPYLLPPFNPATYLPITQNSRLMPTNNIFVLFYFRLRILIWIPARWLMWLNTKSKMSCRGVLPHCC